jgi:hypothetical protein
VIIIKHKHIGIWWIVRAVDARITWAQITSRVIRGHIGERCADTLPYPRPVLAVRSNNDPFLTKRMPAFFPHSGCVIHPDSSFDEYAYIVS